MASVGAVGAFGIADNVSDGVAARSQGDDPAVNAEDAAFALLSGMGDPVAGKVAELEAQRRTIQEERRALLKRRREVQNSIKNEKKKRKRILEKAKSLSDGDLMQVLATRAQNKAQAKPKAKANAASRAVAASAPSA
jgi:seryl-tRNA synthetase